MTILLAIAGAMAPQVALAAPRFDETVVMEQLHAELDRDENGVVSAEEFAEVGAARHFVDLDHNQDGGISVTELRNWVMFTPPRPARNAALKALEVPPDAMPAPQRIQGKQHGNAALSPDAPPPVRPTHAPVARRSDTTNPSNSARAVSAPAAAAQTGGATAESGISITKALAVLSAVIGLSTLVVAALGRGSRRSRSRRRKR